MDGTANIRPGLLVRRMMKKLHAVCHWRRLRK
jgi:hypothetical protein